MKRTDPATLEEQLTDEQRGRLEAGHHAAVARELADAGQHALAGWVLEQIWDFAAALDHYERAGRPLDALRAALELDHPGRLDRVIAALERRISGEPALLEAARAMLERRGRHMEVARLLARGQDDPKDRAEALRRAGSPLEAARVLADAGQLREALELLPLSTEAAGRSSSSSRAPVHALAARLCWELGDVEAAARHAQLALRSGIVEDQRPALVRLMARALVALGHDIAAEVALQGLADGREGEAAGEVPVRGRYHLRETLTACYAGAAYSATDRVTLQEVEVHLLLAEYGESGQADDPGVTRVLDAFARRAEAAARIGHPAIRPILRFDAEAGLLVLPRAEGPTLRSLIRAPGMASAPTRARALVTFLLEGLVAAHARGLVHGSLLPGQIVCDAAGRPLLGPFGAEQLAGLVATRTGTLEELMTVSAPELRRGGPATTESDVFAIAAIFAALLAGTLRFTLDLLDPRERDAIAPALEEDPAMRPSAAELLRALRVRAVDARELGAGAARSASSSASWARIDEGSLASTGVRVEVAASWSDAELDALLSCDHPRLQPVLDRAGRELVLAGWPDGTRRLSEGTDYSRLVPGELLDGLPEAVRAAITHRASERAWVLTPAREWMIALDELLAR